MIAVAAFVGGFIAGLFVCGAHWLHRVQQSRSALLERVRMLRNEPRVTALAESEALRFAVDAVDALLRWPA